MRILTAQDFNEFPYNVPNAYTQAPGGGTEVNIKFENFIDKKVEYILTKILGIELYDSFIAGLEALEEITWSATIPALGYSIDDEVYYEDHVWKSLVDLNLGVAPVEGANWTKVEDNQWLLLKNGVRQYTYGIRKRSWAGMKDMLIPYVYSFWLRATFDDHTSIGVVIRTAENAEVISPGKRIANAYNDFLSKAGDFYNQRNTLYGFLSYSNSELDYYTGYYDFRFGDFTMNTLGI